MEGTARFLSAEGGFADQVRADRRAVPARRADRSRADAATSPARCRACRASWRSAICRWPRTTATASSTRSRFSMRLDEHVAVIGPERQRQERAGAAAGAADAADRRPHHDRRARPRASCRSPWSAAASAMSAATPVPVHRHTARQSAARAAPPAGAAGRIRARPTARRRARQLEEARRSGNIDFDLHADWVDYDAAGVDERRGIVGPHRRAADAARFRDRRLQFRAALPVRSGAAPRADRAAARGAARAARPARRRRDHQSGRDLRPGALQHECQRRGKPAVRHADRPGFRFRGAGRQSVRAAPCSTRSG